MRVVYSFYKSALMGFKCKASGFPILGRFMLAQIDCVFSRKIDIGLKFVFRYHPRRLQSRLNRSLIFAAVIFNGRSRPMKWSACILIAMTSLCGCRAPMPTFSDFFSPGATRVPEPTTDGYGGGGSGYFPNSVVPPNGGASLAPTNKQAPAAGDSAQSVSTACRVLAKAISGSASREKKPARTASSPADSRPPVRSPR